MLKLVSFVLIILTLGLGFYFLFTFKKRETQPESLEKSMIKKRTSETPIEIGEKISIIIIYDNYLVNPQLKTGWGFSSLIKLEDKNILFDTGADSKTLLLNMEKMGIDPKNIDFIFISHLHEDHTGGLSGILEIKPDLKVYKPESFSGPTQIINGVWTTGSLGTRIKEQSLIIDSKKGLIVITGCAHPGIVNILEKTKEMFPKKNIYLVLGGFHLTEVLDFELMSIINNFKKLGIQKAGPCHCSGDRCRELFKKEYGNNFVEVGVGKEIILN